MVPDINEISNLSYDELVEHLRLSRVNAGEYEGLVPVIRDELFRRDPLRDYKCMKCGHNRATEKQIRTAKGFWSAMFDVQVARYRAVVCTRCNFTEFYAGDTSVGQQVADFLFGA